MIKYKSEDEIGIMKEGGLRLRRVVAALLPTIKAGTRTKEIDDRAEQLIIKEGGESSFNKVKGYHWSTCLPVNEQVVHTPPGERILKNGDVLTVDIGMFYKGFHTDYATTFVIGGKTDPKTREFLDTGKNTLTAAIEKARAGHKLGEISETIEKAIKGKGYFIMRDLTGHGVGRDLHEDPFVFGYVDRPVEKTLTIKPGLVIAIEIIYSMGTEEIAYERGDDWSIISADRSLTACFEHTVAVTNDKTLVLT